MQKDSANNYSEIESMKTQNSYARIELKYTKEPNIYYSISAIDEDGLITGTGDTVSLSSPFAIANNPFTGTIQGIDPNADAYNVRNRIKCNGRNYAWELELYQLQVSAANNSIFVPGAASRLYLRPTATNYTDVFGTSIPFYQAMSYINFNQLSSTHPHKMQSGTEDWYKKIPLIDGLVGGPFFDANNNLVQPGEGILIEKKLDQYEHFDGDITNIFYAQASFPDMDVFGWYTAFNNSYAPIAVNGAFPASTSFSYQYGVPSELSCTSAFGVGTGGESVTFEEEDFIETMIDCWDDNATVLNYGDCIDDLFNNGFTVTDVVLVPLVEDGIKHHLVRDSVSKRFIDLDSLSSYNVGLYEAQIFTNSANIYHAVFENLISVDVREDKDFVSMSINPNPIENNTLNLVVKTKKEMTAQLFVYTLNNNMIYNGVINLAINEDFSNSFDIGDYTTVPFNQIKVKLVFNDQSSMIQKTGVR